MRISAVILAGGRGERLYPLTETRPKPLCPVGGVYPLGRAIDMAKEAGAGEIIVTAGYMASAVEAFTNGMEGVTTVREEQPLSTAGAVKHAMPSGELIIVLCGDAMCDFSILPAVKLQKNSDADVTVVTARSPAPTDYGVIQSIGGYITSFFEKPSWSSVGSDEVNTGIYIMRRRVLEQIPSGEPYDFGSQLFPKMLAEEKKIGVYRAEGYWCDMGSPKTYYAANMHATGGKNAIDGSCVIHEKAHVRSSVLLSDVYVGQGSIISDSIVCENVKIGKNCRIEPGCIIGGSTIIEDGCRCERGVTVTNGVYLRKDTHIMKNVYSHEFKTRLFDSELGVGGVYGSGFDISDAVYLGQSLCARGDGRVKVGVMNGSGSFSRILAGVTVGGVRFGGGDAVGLGDGFLSQCAFAARKYGLDYAVFVNVDDDFRINISVFDKNGLFLPRESQRKLERLFFRRTSPKIAPKSDAEEAKSVDTSAAYAEHLKEVAGDLSGVTVAVRSANGPSEAFSKAFVDAGGSIGEGDSVNLSEDGRQMNMVAADGTIVSFWHLWCYVMGEEVKRGTKRVAMPIFSPISVAEYLGGLGGRVVYFSDSETDERDLAGEQWVASDGCTLALRALRLMKENNVTLNEIMNMLPKFFIRELTVPVDEDEKAERARYLHDHCDDTQRCTAFVFGSGRVSVMPSNAACFKLFAEAVSSEAAEEMVFEVRKKFSDK